MYVLVQHTITDPATFWSTAEAATPPAQVRLQHSFPTSDGTRAVCLWEADSVDAVRDLLEPMIGAVSRNEYFAVENREGIGHPSAVAHTAGAGHR